jgi:hypothetical protein
VTGANIGTIISYGKDFRQTRFVAEHRNLAIIERKKFLDPQLVRACDPAGRCIEIPSVEHKPSLSEGFWATTLKVAKRFLGAV